MGPERARGSRRRLVTVAASAVVVVIVVLTLLFAWPLSHSYKFDLTSTGTGATEARSYPTGAQVSVHWESNTGTPAELGVSQRATVLYDVSGTSGTYAFVSNGEPYNFTVVGTSAGLFTYYPPNVGIWGQWSAPLL